MFEHYMKHKQVDPRRRRRVIVAANVAASLTVGMLMFVWVADKMSIAKVEAPTTDYVLVQMMATTATPAPPPPPPPLGSKEAPDEVEEKTPVEDEEIPVEDIVQPDKKQLKPVKDRGDNFLQKRGDPLGHKLGVPGGKKDGVVGNLLNNNKDLVIGDPPGLLQPKKTETRPPEPISAVKSRCDYCPDPDPNKLAGTRAAMFDRRAGTNRTQFCVGPSGTVETAKTVKRFPGDPKVDSICLETVKSWRIKPLRVDGKAIRSCSTVTFKLSFRE